MLQPTNGVDRRGGRGGRVVRNFLVTQFVPRTRMKLGKRATALLKPKEYVALLYAQIIQQGVSLSCRVTTPWNDCPYAKSNANTSVCARLIWFSWPHESENLIQGPSKKVVPRLREIAPWLFLGFTQPRDRSLARPCTKSYPSSIVSIFLDLYSRTPLQFWRRKHKKQQNSTCHL